MSQRKLYDDRVNRHEAFPLQNLDVIGRSFIDTVHPNKRLIAQLRREREEREEYQRLHPREKKEYERKFEVLDGYDKAEADHLQDLVINRKRDIRRIPGLETSAGASSWIEKRNLGKHLKVDNKDIDGDGIIDVIVRRIKDDLPYIINGYKTERSRFPYRQAYYEKYPTRDSRKGIRMGDYVMSELGESYSPDEPTLREYSNKEKNDYYEKLSERGYAKVIPRKKLTVANAFKIHFMKPIMKGIKLALKQANVTLTLSGVDAIQIEKVLRTQFITIPAMIGTYGQDVMDTEKVDIKEWNNLKNRKEFRYTALDLIKSHLTDPAQRKETLSQLAEAVYLKMKQLNNIPNDIPSAVEDSIIALTLENASNIIYQAAGGAKEEVVVEA
jgi:hypothetical protein